VPGFPIIDIAGLVGSTGWGLWIAALGATIALRAIRPTVDRKLVPLSMATVEAAPAEATATMGN
jgi:hypothetical protein